MNIYAEKGTRVVFTGEGGYDSDRDFARKMGLNEGETYTVSKTRVENWVSYVTLVGYDGEFNTTMFS